MTQIAARWLTGKDGVRYRLRPIRASDAGSLMRGYDAMGSQAKRFRLLMTLPHLTEAMALAFCTPDPSDTVCLVVEGQGALAGEIVAGARMAGIGLGTWAEFSVSARPEARELGLTRQSLEAVIDVARARGCSGVWGMIADPNRPMLALARRVGMSIRDDPDDRSLEIAELSFDGTPRTL